MTGRNWGDTMIESHPTSGELGAAVGRPRRRGSLVRWGARGFAWPMETTRCRSSGLAAGAQRGGHLKCGIQGGASTDVLDPAKCTAQVCFMTGRNWGDTLIESHPTSGEPVAALAESWSASPDAKVWTFMIRKGVQLDRKSTRLNSSH